MMVLSFFFVCFWVVTIMVYMVATKNA